MYQAAFKNIDDTLRKDAGCSSELDYIEQTSWVLFLKYLDDFETDRETAAELNGKTYRRIIDGEYRWRAWAAPKRLMRDSELLKDADAKSTALYSVRQKYATLKLLRASTDVYTLAKQMGNSAVAMERRYSKLIATMAASRRA
jgi:hypothetical protein